MSDILGQIFGSVARVKLMRLFIFNSEEPFTLVDSAKRASVSVATARRENNALLRSDFIKKKTFYKEVAKKRRGKTLVERERVSGFVFNEKFPFTDQFKNILMDAAPLRGDKLVRRFAKAGKIKLVVVSGVFIHEADSRLDLLVVGDRLNKVNVDRAVRGIESEIGRELRYAVLETPDFNYRRSVYDRLLRDVFEFPHQRVLDKMGDLAD